MVSYKLIFLGIILVVIGFVIMFIGTILTAYKSEASKESKTKIGGVVLIGPVPLIFGNDTQTVNLTLILAIILTIIAIFLFFYGFKMRI